eukprot:366460-Chlamydomonas_euryale.AAC.3
MPWPPVSANRVLKVCPAVGGRCKLLLVCSAYDKFWPNGLACCNQWLVGAACGKLCLDGIASGTNALGGGIAMLWAWRMPAATVTVRHPLSSAFCSCHVVTGEKGGCGTTV